jgi:hypothetical protein
MLWKFKILPISQTRLISNGVKRLQNTSATKSGESSSFGESETQSKDSDDIDFIVNIPEAEEAIEREEKFKRHVEKMRDVSRFTKRTALEKHRGNLPTFSDPEARYLKEPKYFRKYYALFGKASGIEPGIAWPHKQELQEIIKEEKEYDLTLEQKVNILIERKQKKYEEFMKMFEISSYLKFSKRKLKKNYFIGEKMWTSRLRKCQNKLKTFFNELLKKKKRTRSV